LRARGGRVVIVSSIAHDYSKTDETDVDFSTRSRASLVYGNAKRYLTYALAELFKNEREITLSITHPGISFTGITAHYPKVIYALIKYPMKLIFMKPKRACLSTLRGVFAPTEHGTWLGPRYFNVWGLPKKHALRTADEKERAYIAQTAERLYEKHK
jgi:NAD(P)-dependent dehydrogenase (short-subunit alcohol dehydrogenase family)